MKFYFIYVQGILNEYSPTENGDSRIVNITVKHLLHHSAGWDRDRAGDPVFWKVGKHMNVAEPVVPSVLIQYMMGKKLQFAPGEYFTVLITVKPIKLTLRVLAIRMLSYGCTLQQCTTHIGHFQDSF